MGLAQGQTIQAAHKTESSDFYPDNWNKGFDEAEPPSDAVLDALLKTQEAKEHWDQLKSLDRERLRKIFLVVRVHLTNFDEKDEVVLGSDPLSGADCDWFWSSGTWAVARMSSSSLTDLSCDFPGAVQTATGRS
jgi:hypothetical protein